MKKCINTILATMLVCVMAVFVGCSEDYQSDIDSLSDRLTEVESQLSELEKSIDDGLQITNVESTSDGITITLSDGKSYDVNNGKDGSVVEIKNGNWYIDGVDQNIAAAGVNGNYYMPDTSTGTFIEYVWNTTAEAYEKGNDTGISFVTSGSITAISNEDGSVTITGISDASGNSTTVTLGVVNVTSILVSEASGDGFVFNSQCDMPIASPYYLVSALPNQTLLSSNESYKYIVNPSNATEPKSWEMLAVSVTTRSSNTLAMKNTAYALGSGFVAVTGKFDVANLPAAAVNTENRFYIQANVDDDMIVKSNNAVIDPINLKAVFIGDAKGNTAYKSAAAIADDYSTTIPSTSVAVPATHQLVWSDSGTAYDLSSYVYASAYGDITAETGRNWLDNYKVTDYSFRFSMPDTYLGADGVTNQQDFATITEDGKMSLVSAFGTSAKNRTPLVKVELMSDTDFGTALVVATAYFKVQFVDTVPSTSTKDNINIGMTKVTVNYADLYAATLPATAATTYEMTMSWTDMNQLVYNNAALQMSYEEFSQNYDTLNPVLTIPVTSTSYGTLTAWTYSNTETPTDLYGLNVLGTTKWGTYTWSVTYKSNDTTKYGDVVITHEFEVVEPTAQLPAFESVYVVNGVQTTKGREVSGRHEMSVQPSEAFVNYLSDYLAVETSLNTTYSNTLTYSSSITTIGITGVQLTNSAATNVTDIKQQVLSLTTALTTSSKGVDMQFAVTYENGEKHSEDWIICFENPISITFDEMKIATDDVATTLDVMQYITVMFNKTVAYSPSTGWDLAVQAKYGLDFKSITANTLSAADELTFSPSYVFTWNNKGSKPQEDFKGADVYVVVKGDYGTSGQTNSYAERDNTGSLTILKY